MTPTLLAFAGLSIGLGMAAPAPGSDEAVWLTWRSWNTPVKPFRVVGNIYYVGVSGVSSFLIATPEGHILLDTGFEMTVPHIRTNIATLGFKLEDVRILLSSHAHMDHVGGHALMRRLTGAKILMSEADAALVASGGTTDFTPYSTNMTAYPPAKADQLLREGERITLGGSTLVCHLTPGHTKGCTTWTMDLSEEGKLRHVLFFGSTTVLDGVSLVNNPKYPNIVQDYLATFAKLKALPCDVFLAPHAGFFNLAEKMRRVELGEKPNPFIVPGEFTAFLQKAEEAFQQRLRQEQKQLGGG